VLVARVDSLNSSTASAARSARLLRLATSMSSTIAKVENHISCGVLPRLDGVLEQRGFADARVPVHDQDPAAAFARGVEQPFQHVALALAAHELLAPRPRDHSDLRVSNDGTGWWD
jgi:hypothetical protein